MNGVLCPNSFPARVLGYRRFNRTNARRVLKQSTRHCCLKASLSGVNTQRTRRVVKQKKSRSTRVQSALGFITYASPSREFFDAAINSLVGGSAMICFALAFVPLLTYEEESNEQMEPDELETIKWSVAGVVSCFPYLNWTSWLFIAFDSELPMPYYFLSALYLIPFLKSGFDLNPFSIFMLVLGFMHMQVERVAQTEPALLGTVVEERPQLPSFVSQISQSIAEQFPSVLSKSTEYLESKKKDISVSEMVDRETVEKEKELQDAEELARIEQKFWDEKFGDKKGKK